MATVLIIDYGTGNLNSVKRTLTRIGALSSVSSSPSEVIRASKIIMPGVGHFGRAMEKLRELGLIDALNEAVLGQKTPVLGICLGMELMALCSEEGDSPGLGWFDAAVVKFDLPKGNRYKVPHMGWNSIALSKDSPLTQGVDDSAEFYFAHSYYFVARDRSDILCKTEYCIDFASGVQKDNIFGVQYHPEKSHDAGAMLLRNFVEL